MVVDTRILEVRPNATYQDVIDAPEHEAFTLDSGQWRLVAALRDDREICLAPFEAISFSLSELWED
jgi:hypothetical protein